MPLLLITNCCYGEFFGMSVCTSQRKCVNHQTTFSSSTFNCEKNLFQIIVYDNSLKRFQSN